MGAFSDFITSFATIMPEVPKPIKKLSLNERLLWTAAVLVVYFVMVSIPLYGVSQGGSDILTYSRIIFASAQGTLMELGIGPIVTAGLIVQLLQGADIIKLDLTKSEDRATFTASTKFATILVALMEVSAFILGGVFGASLTPQIIIIIMFQLFIATVIVMLMDELVQKGWGVGSGISLFIFAGAAVSIIWGILSPLPVTEVVKGVNVTSAYGLIPYLIEQASTSSLARLFYRSSGYPSILTVLVTMLIILIVVYVEGLRVEIPITSAKYRGFGGVYPIKFLYVSNIPIILTSALLTDANFIFQFLWVRFNPQNKNSLLNLLGKFNSTTTTPTGGLAYYLTAPTGLSSLITDPVHCLFFILLITAFCVVFAKIWVEIGGLSAEKVAKNLVDAGVQVPGFRRSEVSISQILAKYIPTLTILGGLFIGLLAGFSDLFSVLGSGIGILLMVDIGIQYYQTLVQEQMEELMPRLSGILGRS
ncbi:MAG: preprotein translocase subunit SecY [Nitrososphaeria archaeon]